VTEPAVQDAPSTGVPAVDEALAALSTLEGRPLAEHVAALDDAHRRLQDALATLDEA
jgi:hypothetical protein